MKKVVLVLGIIVLILGIALPIVASTGIVSFTSVKTNIVSGNTADLPSKLPLTLFTVPTDVKQPPIHGSVTVRAAVTPSINDQTFTFKLFIKFLDQDYGGCQANVNCLAKEVEKTISGGRNQVDLVFPVNQIISIPLLMAGQKIDSNIRHQYILGIESNNSFSYDIESELNDRLLAPIGLVLLVIGLIVTILGLVLSENGAKQQKGRALPLQPAFEPTLGGGSRKVSASSSRRSSKTQSKKKDSKKGKAASSSRKASTATCRSCGGVMPRNAQYCPHCYARQ